MVSLSILKGAYSFLIRLVSGVRRLRGVRKYPQRTERRWNARRDHPCRPTRLLQELSERMENNEPGDAGGKLDLCQRQLDPLNSSERTRHTIFHHFLEDAQLANHVVLV